MPKQYIVELCAIDPNRIQEKQKISPTGKVTGLDGRVFTVPQHAVFDAIVAAGLQLPLMIDHRWAGEAAGWFRDYELRDDGIYAQLQPTNIGTPLIEQDHYKYLSPEYLVNYDTHEVETIVGMGLVNKPNVLNDALNQQEPQAMATPNDGDDADLQTQIDRLTQANKALTDQNAELVTQLSTNKIDSAIANGNLAPAKRDFALKLDANALDGYLAVEAQTFQKTENNGIQQDQSNQDSDADCPVLAQLNIDAET